MGLSKIAITCGGLGIWWLIDIFFSHNRAREKNYTAIMQAAHYYGQHRPQQQAPARPQQQSPVRPQQPPNIRR